MRSPKPEWASSRRPLGRYTVRAVIVDRCAAIFLKRRDLLAWLWDLLAWLWDLLAWLRGANVHFRNGRFRRRIGSLLLDLPIRRQSQTVCKHLHRRRETLVEGRLAIISRGESIVERLRTILQSGETLLERRVPARGRVRQHAPPVGWGIETDLRFQACQSYAIAQGVPDPSGALSRKSSGWIVPKAETREPGNPGAAGPACVPADLRTNPKSIAAIPSGIARTPN
jgi:hypothetical protein